jgi:NADPH-dependent glutamate synthase beta subunit-like oxidoreductase
MLGRDFDLRWLSSQPGVAAVVLANGAWRDRPLQLPGIERLQGRGFLYQNAFVYWFNHYEDVDYDGPTYAIEPGTIVIGGGLASVDVAKIVNLELYRRALKSRAIEVSIVELEHLGITKVLAAHGLRVDDLGIEGATIYYRRRIRDMPIAFPKDDSPAQLAKTELVREKMVQILAQKYLIKVEQCHIPIAAVIDGERMSGVRFRRSQLQDGKLVEIAGSDYDVTSKLVVSSIGSVPEPIAGVPLRGELYDYADFESGTVRGLPGVFGLGNVLTGKGNIKDSRDNAREITARTLATHMGLHDDAESPLLPSLADADKPAVVHDEVARATALIEAQAATAALHAAARTHVEPVIDKAERARPATPEELRAFLTPLFARWRELDYSGDYRAWIESHRPG